MKSNPRYILLTIALATFGVGFWTGCTTSFDVEEDGVFICTTDDDCVDGFECKNDVCVTRVDPGDETCVDSDEDGFGVGTAEERQKCARCTQFGQCEEDCNDTDPAINPGAIERCNNIDDNCNETVDEPSACTDDRDCQALTGSIPANTQAGCGESGFCEVTMTTQLCFGGQDPCPCNSDAQTCTDGMYPVIPDPSECL